MRFASLLSVLLMAWSGAAFAGSDSARYVNGVEGLRAGSVPPPGFYYRSYNLWYHADELTDRNGDELDLGFELDLAATVQRLIYVNDFPKKAIGANYGAYLIVPTYYASLQMDAAGIDDDRFRVGDVELCPLLLSWNKERFDFAVAYDIFFPTGDRDLGEAATLGREYYTHMISVGGTGYLDPEKTWTFSLLGRYEINHERSSDRYRAGDQFHLEWGAGKAFPKLGLEVGIVGYAGWQTTDDSGRGVAWDKSVRDRVFAVGPEVNYTIKPVGLHMALRFEKEFCARDHTQGHILNLTLTKRF